MKNYFGRILNFIKLKPNLDYLLICVIGLHVLYWFKDNVLYIGGDSGIMLNPFKNLQHLFTWKPQLGGVESWNLTAFFQYSIFALMKFLKLDLVQSQRIFIYLMRTLSGIGMYYLVSAFKDIKRIGRLIASLFYMFNPYMLGLVIIPTFIPYSVAPLAIGFYVRTVLKSEFRITYTLLCVAAFLLMLGDLPNYKHIFVPFLIIFLFTIFRSIFSKTRKREPLFIFSVFIITFMMLTLWFTLPYLSLLNQNSIAEFVKDHGIAFEDYGYANIANLLRLFGSGSFHAGGFTKGTVYFTNFFLILCGYLLTVLIFSSVVFRPSSKEVTFFSLLAVIFIFLAKGTNPPLGGIYRYMVLHFPLLRVFRTSWSLLYGTAIAYSFLLGITTESIYLKLKSKLEKSLLSKLSVIIIITLILINGWPFLTGDKLYNIYNPPSYNGYRIPLSYFEAEEYMAKDNNNAPFFKIPAADGGYIYTTWNYRGSNIIPYIFSNPFIDGFYLNNASRPFLKFIYTLIEKKDFDNLSKILGLLNVHYLVADGYDKTNNFNEELKAYLENFEKIRGMTFEKKFGQIYIYRNNFVLPHIYAASCAILVCSDNLYALLPLSNFDYINENNVFLFNKQQYTDSRQSKDSLRLDGRILNKISEIVVTCSDSISDDIKQDRLSLNKEILNKMNISYLFYTDFDNPAYDKKKIHVIEDGIFYTQVLNRNSLSQSNTLLEDTRDYIVLDDYGKTIYLNKAKKEKLGNSSQDNTGRIGLEKGIYDIRVLDKDLIFKASKFKYKPLDKDNLPSLQFRKINHTEYRAIIKAKESFWLVFGETFHKCWKAYVKNVVKNKPEKKVTLDEHFLVNGFANGWYMDMTRVRRTLGDYNEYEVVIYYLPQKLFYLGLGISALTFLVCVGYLGVNFLKDRLKRRFKERL